MLAHSHSWRAPNSTPDTNIAQKLFNSDELHITHPRECLDLLCVADLGTWKTMKMLGTLALASHHKIPLNIVLESGLALQTSYMMATSIHKNQSEYFTPIGSLILDLSRKIAWEDTQLREISQYYQDTEMGGTGEGKIRQWNFSFSENVMRRLQNHRFNLENWNEWSIISGF